jgi:hypothetical protein
MIRIGTALVFAVLASAEKRSGYSQQLFTTVSPATASFWRAIGPRESALPMRLIAQSQERSQPIHQDIDQAWRAGLPVRTGVATMEAFPRGKFDLLRRHIYSTDIFHREI